MCIRDRFRALADQREATQKTAAAALEAAFDFMEQAFAESPEMVVFVTELTVNPASHQDVYKRQWLHWSAWALR